MTIAQACGFVVEEHLAGPYYLIGVDADDYLPWELFAAFYFNGFRNVHFIFLR
jgi:hypothetical protein